MKKLIIPANHICLTSTKEVNAICEPLFKYLGLKYFVYNRTYTKTNTGFALFSHSEWTEFFFREDYLHRLSFLGLHEHGQFSDYKFILTSLFPENRMLKNLQDYFQIGNGIIVCKQYEDYCEWCTFAGDVNDTMLLHRYLNNFDQLIKFIHYFKLQASHLIQAAEKTSLPFPQAKLQQKIYLQEDVAKLLWNDTEANAFAKKLKAHQQFNVIMDGKKIVFTTREMDCLFYLCRGYSAKMIGKTLGLSPRTVESHLYSARTKLHCNSKAELLKAIADQLKFYIPESAIAEV